MHWAINTNMMRIFLVLAVASSTTGCGKLKDSDAGGMLGGAPATSTAAEEPKDPAEIFKKYSKEGDDAMTAKNYVDAEKYYLKARDAAESVDVHGPALAQTAMNLGMVYEKRQMFESAIPFFKQSATIFKVSDGRTSASYIAALKGHERMLRDLKKDADADKLEQKIKIAIKDGEAAKAEKKVKQASKNKDKDKDSSAE